MNRTIHFLSTSRTAAMTLLAALLTATTAGAQDAISGLTYNSADGYYEISDAQDLVDLANYVNGGNNASGKTFKQTQDIDMSSAGNFEPIGSQPNNYNSTPFNGTYDGQGHAIIGLTVNTSSPYAGLFGHFEGGSVRNLTMVNPNVTSNDNSQGSKYAGGIVGYIQNSKIENCNVINPTLKTSSGNGSNNKGAICGGIGGGYCVVTDCYFSTTGNVSAVGANPLNVSVTASRTYALTLGDGITTSTAPTFSYGGTGYYVSGTTITLGGLSDRTGYTSDYAASGSVTVTNNQFAMPDGDVTVTAVYTPITYTITYHAGDGVDFSTDKNAYTVESATITLDQPSPKTGYTFSGWYANAGLTGDAITAIATGSTGNVELWAKWTANTYTVHFEPVIPVNGTMPDQTFTYDQEATALTKNAFSTTTGQWLRWNTKADGSGTDYEDEALVQNLTAEDGGVVTLYAQWRLQHRYNYDSSIFRCYNVGTPNQVYWAYAGETVKVEVIDGTSEYTIRVVNGDGEDITLDTGTNTFVMPDEEVWITYTSVKKMAYTTICLDDFDDSEDVAYLYDASQPTVTPTVVVKDGETVLTEGTDYTLAITNNTGSATQMVTATVTVTGMGGYVGTNTREFRITPFNIANCEIKGTLEVYYDGYGVYYPLKRNVQVWNGETQLEVDTDYSLDVEYADSYVVGQFYNATVKGTGDWGGSKTFQFKVIALHHTVVFEANGGSGTMEGGTVGNEGGYAGQYYLPACGFTAPDGKKFDHWVASCEPDAEKQPGNYFTAPYIWNESDVQTITVTAYWRDKATFTVTLPEDMEVVSGTLTDGKAIEDEVITFRPRPGFTATDVQANGTALTPDGEGIYTLTVTADVTVTVGALAPIDWATVNDGTDADPYMIYNKDQLLLLAHRVNGTNSETANDYEGKFFKLGADITFDHDADEGDDYDENYEAIGNGYHYFKGNFDGANHTVSGIRIRKDGKGINYNYLGIFGQTSDGSIHDVHLTDARIKGYSYVGGIVGYNTSSCNVSGCTVTDSYITATTNSNYYGTICGYNNTGYYGGHLTNNYYHGCTVNGTAVTSGVGCQGADLTDNNGALPAYAITLGDGVSTTVLASEPENGFVKGGISYYRLGLALPLASEAPEGYTLSFSANGTALSGNTYTVNATDGDVTINTTLRSDGLEHEVNYMTADGTTAQAKAIALDGHETVDSYGYVRLDEGTYYVGTDIATANRIWLDGDVTLILADGKNMTLNGWGIAGGRNLTIYGQSLDAATAGTLSYDGTSDGINADKYVQHSGNVSITTSGSSVFGIDAHVTLLGGTLTISANGDDARAINGTRHSILGGQLTATATGTNATGILASDLTLGWTRPDDRITASSISTDDGGTVAVADGKALTDGSGHIYTGTLSAAAIGGQTLQPCLALADAADNTDAIDDHAGKTLAVALSGRTLYKDGSWNTLCLPFSVSTESGTLSGNGVQAMTLDTETSSLAGGTLTLNFDAATTIPAGTPFIIKWDGDGSSNITNPVFEGVAIDADKHDATVEGVLTFTGTYAPVSIGSEGDNTKLYLGSSNTLHYPNGEMTIGCHRAYFQLKQGLSVGDPSSSAHAIVLNFGGGTTSVQNVQSSMFNVQSDDWYTLDGRKLDGKPTQRGIYIHKGNKIVINRL